MTNLDQITSLIICQQEVNHYYSHVTNAMQCNAECTCAKMFSLFLKREALLKTVKCFGKILSHTNVLDIVFVTPTDLHNSTVKCLKVATKNYTFG